MEVAPGNPTAVIEPRLCRFEPGFLSSADCQTLLDWARGMPPHMIRGSDTDRYFGKLADLPDVPMLCTEVRLRLENLFGLDGIAVQEVRHGWFLSIGNAGSLIRPHHDLPPDGKRILRCNLFLELPVEGGWPVIEDVPFDVRPGTLLAFLPSELLHWSQPVLGATPRVMLSFGYTVPGDYLLPAPTLTRGEPAL